MDLRVTRGLAVLNPAPSLGVRYERAGLYRVLAAEYARLRSRHMDADAGADDETLAEQIASELCASGDEAEVCYREGQRYRAGLRELAVPDGEPARRFPADHVLLITGGTRGLGLLCARHFVRHYGVRRLVLTGREALPPREQWGAHESGDDTVGRKLRAVRALEEEGASVEVLSVSLSDEGALRRRVEQIKATLGPISGVLHCADSFDHDNPAFVRKTVARMRALFAPKMAGLDRLLESLEHEPLQWCVLFSSVSAAVPSLGVGQSDYATANAYMDHVARAWAARLPIVSIQWPSWKRDGPRRRAAPPTSAWAS